MKILIICSKKFYDRVEDIKTNLESRGHEIYLPNCYDAPETEDKFRVMGKLEHANFKREMFKQSEQVISTMDAVLVLNYEKNGMKNYIGGATFLEMYDAFRLDKKVFMINDIPDNILKDEIIGFSPIIIKGELNLIN